MCDQGYIVSFRSKGYEIKLENKGEIIAKGAKPSKTYTYSRKKMRNVIWESLMKVGCGTKD